MKDFIPRYTENDLERVIKRDYGVNEIDEVKELINRYGKSPNQKEKLRVQMACLKCANGNIEELKNYIYLAVEIDYRDVLLTAEYTKNTNPINACGNFEPFTTNEDELNSWLNRK